jgi:hypothetical protein
VDGVLYIACASYRQGLIQDFYVEGGNSRARHRTQTRGVWGHAPPENFCNLRPLRLFLVASETTYTNNYILFYYTLQYVLV